ncbi:hypothetical protein NEIELOOT_02722 [Neisseria elongata subsp. glycolytica ATCC 29315]|uniref:Uncharacterized protein n=1 Tax=Neisseria elongata subsp. glycolytica ATCC 29315 TaxID=546263 RepID=D4DUG2_NEIEG|nr:hypothetical protein NEIELOOT_02722 [Neisseria elongata subsp. glycolytica ATCC 29315]
MKLPCGGIEEVQFVGRLGVGADDAHGDVGVAVAVVVLDVDQAADFFFKRTEVDEIFNDLHFAGFLVGNFHLVGVHLVGVVGGEDLGFDGKGKTGGRGDGISGDGRRIGGGYRAVGGKSRDEGGKEQGGDNVFHGRSFNEYCKT